MLKKILSLLLALTMGAAMMACATAAYDNGTDYMAVMIEAAKTGDYARGNAAEAARNEKIDTLGLSAKKIKFQDLYLLSKVMYIEAGSPRLSDEWILCVGEVLLNRVASPEFPNTVYDVVYQRGQYASAGTSAWAGMMPNERCIRLAIRLLQGERHMESSVVFQANFRQGSGVYKAMYDSLYGWTYFCYSSYPWLYSNQNAEVNENPTPTPDNSKNNTPAAPEDTTPPAPTAPVRDDVLTSSVNPGTALADRLRYAAR